MQGFGPPTASAVSRPLAESIEYAELVGALNQTVAGGGLLLLRTTTGTVIMSPGITYTVSSSRVMSSVSDTTTNPRPVSPCACAVITTAPRFRPVMLPDNESIRATDVSLLAQITWPGGAGLPPGAM